MAIKLGRNLGSADFFGSRPFFRSEISVRPKKSLFLDVGGLPPPFIFFKNDNVTKLTRALHKARVSVFGMGTNISIDFMVIEKFAKLAKKPMSKLGFLRF